MPVPSWLRVLLGTVAVLLQAPSASSQQDPAEQRRVLVLHALRPDAPAYVIKERIYQQRLNEGIAGHLDYYSEFLDITRFEESGYEDAFVDFLVRKYQGRRFDLVIANGPTDLAFAARLRPRLFPDAPIVFSGTRARMVSNSTGFFYSFAMKETLALALQLQPSTKHIFVVCGSSGADRYYEDAFRAQVPAAPPGTELTYLRDLPLARLTERLASLPAHSIILMVSQAEDGAGDRYLTAEIAERLARVANAPIYSWNGNDRGVFGGKVLSSERLAEETAALALRVLGGEPADSIPLYPVDPTERQIDWRQLARWNISEGQIPPDVLVRFREPGLLERYRGYIFGTVALVTLQAALIVGLLIHRRRRRRAEDALRESEAALRQGHDQIRDLAGRLITAQEAERARIARELHDDISQQLAGFSMTLSGIKRRPDVSGNIDLQQTLASLQGRTIELADGVRHLSHELHSSVLQHAGLPDALRAHCSEVSQQHQLSIDLGVQPDLQALDEGTSLCLYRITQEALRNIVKHAEARHVDVRLTRQNGELDLSIADDGRGFDLSAVQGARFGLGLRSIEERARLSRGRVDIETAPGRGTKLSVRLQAASPPAMPV